MQTLYDIVMEFWTFWFPTAQFGDSVLQLICFVSTVAIVYGVLILPFLKLFRGRRK